MHHTIREKTEPMKKDAMQACSKKYIEWYLSQIFCFSYEMARASKFQWNDDIIGLKREKYWLYDTSFRTKICNQI